MTYMHSLNWDEYLAALGEPGRQIVFDDGRAASLEFVDAGRLRLSSGRVSVRDPVGNHDPEWDSDMIFVTVPPASYPVEIVSADFEVQGRRVALGAAVRVKITKNRPTSWSAAVGASLDGAGCFGVDAGAGIIMDADHLLLLNDPDFERLLEETVWAEQLFVGHPATGDRDAVAFGCGMGDGCYAVLLGHDHTGSLAEILVDLELCRWSPEWADIRDGEPS